MSQGVLVDGPPDVAAPSYDEVATALRAVVAELVPPGGNVLVVSRGDDELLELPGRTGHHFPQSADGEYAGHHPDSGRAAVDHLEALRRHGAEYLALPATAYWWLDHYGEFARHLEGSCTLLARDQHCALYELERNRLPRRALRALRRRRFAGDEDAAPRRPRTVPVSVVVTSHDKGSYLRETLDSLAAQSVRPAEVILVDDASSDDTEAIARDRGVRYARVELHSPGLARNRGAELATGELLCFLDGDDLLAPDFLEAHARALADHPRAGFAFGRIREFGEREELWPRHDWDFDLLRRRNYIPAASIVRAHAFRHVGGYPDLAGAEDWGLWLTLSAAGWEGVPCRTTWRWRRTASSRNATRTWHTGRSWAQETPLGCFRLAVVTDLVDDPGLVDRWLGVVEALDWPKARMEVCVRDRSPRPELRARLARRLVGCGGLHVLGQGGAGKGVERSADFVLFLSPTCVPDAPDQLLGGLLGALDAETFAVFGWSADPDGRPRIVGTPASGSDWSWTLLKRPQSGVTEVGGGALDCALVRSEALRGVALQDDDGPGGAAAALSRALWLEGRRMVCDWEGRCSR